MNSMVKFPIEKSLKEVITENRAKRIAETARMETEIEELNAKLAHLKIHDYDYA